MKTIVVGFDDSDQAKRALERAAELAEMFQSKLIVTSVVPVEYYAARSAGPISPGEGVAEHKAELEDAKQLLGNRGVDAEYVEPVGEPADSIVEIAHERGADLVVVGTRDPGFVARLLGQSVSESVARHADCDVLIVK